VRLGQRERALLLAAPPPGSFERDGAVTGGMAVHGHNIGRVVNQPRDLIVTETARPARVAALRAAKRLEDLGLVDYRQQLRGERRAYIALTNLGAAVVGRYRAELETGGRIRWADNSEFSPERSDRQER
jgi:DNA-binding transcriptional ArsR family regulator